MLAVFRNNFSEPNVKYLSWIITLPITLIVVIFAISNMNPVAFGLWPLEETLSLPLYIAVLLTFVVGFLCGGIILWLSSGKLRRRLRRAEFDAVSLKRENDGLKKRLSQQSAAAARGTGSEAGRTAPGSNFQIAATGQAAVGRSPAGLPGA